MKSLKNVAACALACALVSAAPAGSVEPAPKPGDPVWVESMQRLVKDLSDDNIKLRREVLDLRDQRDFLNRRLDECEAQLQKQRDQRGAFNVPPDLQVAPAAPRGQVPSGWRPFEFNGATYYIVPLGHHTAAGKSTGAAPGQQPAATLPEATK